MGRKTVLFLSIFFVALTAGAAFAVWLDSNPSGMSASFYVEKMQHEIRIFSIPLNTVAILGVLFTLCSTFLARHDRLAFRVLMIASTCALAAILITIFGNVPIINQITKWSNSPAPSNWIQVGSRWWLLQTVRTIFVIVELSFLIASALVSSRDLELDVTNR